MSNLMPIERFASKIVVQRGHLPESEVAVLGDAGFSDGEVAEIIAVVVLNIYRSYFNLIARPEIDFPVVAAAGSPLDPGKITEQHP